MSSYAHSQFLAKIKTALVTVKQILNDTKHPAAADDVDHKYDDKFLLAEFLTNTAIRTVTDTLGELGVTPAHLAEASDWAEKSAVYLAYSSESWCDFKNKTEERVETPVREVTIDKTKTQDGKDTGKGSKTTMVEKKITIVKKFFWTYKINYTLSLYSRANQKIVIAERSHKAILETGSDHTPETKHSKVGDSTLHLNWLFKNMDANGDGVFSINRDDVRCKTPRRNQDIPSALSFMSTVSSWGSNLLSFCTGQWAKQPKHGMNVSSLTSDTTFLPYWPLFRDEKDHSVLSLPEKKDEKKGGDDDDEKAARGALLSIKEIAGLIGGHLSGLRSRLSVSEGMCPAYAAGGPIINKLWARVALVASHLGRISQQYQQGIDHIENMLYTQLVSAIGKVVTPTDFAEYMVYHNRKLLKAQYRPRPFCYAVRRPGHYPEGEITLEGQASGAKMPQPVMTQVYANPRAQTMFFPISAATSVTFSGKQYLHAWMTHQFAGDAGSKFLLTARARQFSSFILVIGRINSPYEFAPKHAMIIQNKDDLKIPLLMEQLPTAAQFRDAISSLSPEQQAFAKAYRSMQLESTMFGMVVIQIKPQLELLLKLPAGSLTKERKLMQDLMKLFIKYQIPSDLVTADTESPDSVDGKEPTKKEKVAQVKRQVALILAEIEEEGKGQLEEKKREAQMAVQETISRSPRLALADSFGSSPSYSSAPMMQSVSLSSSSSSSFAMPSAPPSRGGRGASGMMRRSAAGPRPSPSPSRSAPAPAPSRPKPSPSPSPAPSQPDVKSNANPATAGNASGGLDEVDGADALDYTSIPVKIDSTFDQWDPTSTLKASIVKLGDTWTKSSQASLLSKPTTSTLRAEQQKEEKQKAFDLLDALSRSGDLPMVQAELHVVLSVAHCFASNLMDTVIKENINPIAKLERSVLLMGSVVQQQSYAELVQPSHQARLAQEYKWPQLTLAEQEQKEAVKKE